MCFYNSILSLVFLQNCRILHVVLRMFSVCILTTWLSNEGKMPDCFVCGYASEVGKWVEREKHFKQTTKITPLVFWPESLSSLLCIGPLSFQGIKKYMRQDVLLSYQNSGPDSRFSHSIKMVIIQTYNILNYTLEKQFNNLWQDRLQNELYWELDHLWTREAERGVLRDSTGIVPE